MVETIGENKTFEIIKMIGKAQGSLAVKSGLSKFGKMGEKFLELEVGLAEMPGWGKFKLINIDIKKANGIIHVDSNFAKEYLQKFGKSKKPIDYFFIDLIEGFSESFSGRKIVCRETKYIEMGHTYCEFIIEPKRNSFIPLFLFYPAVIGLKSNCIFPER